MKIRTLTALLVFLSGFVITFAWGQIHLPKGLEGVVPRYPGAKVVTAFNWQGNAQTRMEAKDDSKAVMVFYRKAMAYKGWSIMTGMILKRGRTLIFSKTNQVLQISAQESEEQKTTILVSITY